MIPILAVLLLAQTTLLLLVLSKVLRHLEILHVEVRRVRSMGAIHADKIQDRIEDLRRAQPTCYLAKGDQSNDPN